MQFPLSETVVANLLTMLGVAVTALFSLYKFRAHGREKEVRDWRTDLQASRDELEAENRKLREELRVEREQSYGARLAAVVADRDRLAERLTELEARLREKGS